MYKFMQIYVGIVDLFSTMQMTSGRDVDRMPSRSSLPTSRILTATVLTQMRMTPTNMTTPNSTILLTTTKGTI